MISVIKEECGIFLANHEEKVKKENDEEISNLAFLINFNDHLQIVSLTRQSNLKELYTRTADIEKHLSSKLKFDKNDDSGFLSVCPTNCGSGLKISAFIKIPKVINDGNLQLLLNKWSLRSKKNLIPFFSETFEILSKCKLKVDVTSFLNSFNIKINSLIHFEEKLDEEPSFLMKKLTHLSSSTKKVYEYFYDNYKLVSTHNTQSSFFFNGLFTNLNSETEVCPTTYASPHIYRDFFNDYITGETGVNMIKFIASPLAHNEYEEDKNIDISHLAERATVIFEVARNLKNLNFFNSPADKANILSHEAENQIFEEIKKVYPQATKNSNEIEIAEHSTKIYLASQETVNQTKGNHVRIVGSTLNFIHQVLGILEHNHHFTYDPIYGYLTRNLLDSGSGFVVIAEFKKSETNKLDNAITICEKHDIKLVSDLPDKIVVRSQFSVTKPKSAILESLIKLDAELFPVVPVVSN